MPLYLQWALSATQICLAVAVLVGIGLLVWDMTAPIGSYDEIDQPEWYLEEREKHEE